MPARRTPLVFSAVLALALLLTGCGAVLTGAVSAQHSASESSAADGEAGDAPLAVTLPASTLDFTATTLTGQPFAGATALAGKPTVIWFWTPGSPACLAEAPSIQAASARFGQQVTFVGVVTGDAGESAKFVADSGLGGFPHLLDADRTVSIRFQISRQSAFAFVKPDGTIQRVAGSLTDVQLSERITAIAQP